jgi:DNA-binding transcriptional ArsR family regulator
MSRISQSNQRATEATEVLKAIAHPVRLRIIAILSEGDEHVNGLAERLGVQQSITSQQLRILRMRRLVESVRENGFARYRLAEPHLRQMIQCMDSCLTPEEGISA